MGLIGRIPVVAWARAELEVVEAIALDDAERLEAPAARAKGSGDDHVRGSIDLRRRLAQAQQDFLLGVHIDRRGEYRDEAASRIPVEEIGEAADVPGDVETGTDLLALGFQVVDQRQPDFAFSDQLLGQLIRMPFVAEGFGSIGLHRPCRSDASDALEDYQELFGGLSDDLLVDPFRGGVVVARDE